MPGRTQEGVVSRCISSTKHIIQFMIHYPPITPIAADFIETLTFSRIIRTSAAERIIRYHYHTAIPRAPCVLAAQSLGDALAVKTYLRRSAQFVKEYISRLAGHAKILHNRSDLL